jgi:hypothetical protein
VRDFTLQVRDDLSGLLLVVLGLFDELPGLIDLLSEDSDGLRVLLGQLDGCLDSCSVLENGLVQILASIK